MRLLLDSHLLVAIGRRTLQRDHPTISSAINRFGNELHASAASLWELAIKVRLGRLDVGVPLNQFDIVLRQGGILILPIEASHALAAAEPEPPTRDPFDRMLLAQCAVEGLKLVTVDRALVDHPLAWRPG